MSIGPPLARTVSLDVHINNSTDSGGELNGNRSGLHGHSAIEPTPVSFNTKLSGLHMLSFEDPRWNGLTAGYRTAIDLRPILQRLESARDAKQAWDELWQELYHQGDIGEGSFVAVPHLVRIHRLRGMQDWNTYALAATIELARGKDGNPDVPAWACHSYDEALRELGQLGLTELSHASDQESVRSILGLLAIVHGARTYGRILVEFTEDEIVELEKQAYGGSEDAG